MSLMTFADVARFHGHICPGLSVGYRMACAAMEHLGASRARDEGLVAIVENDACGVDAVQCVCGCTFGKGNLLHRDYGKNAYTFYLRKSKEAIRVLYHGRDVPEAVRQDRDALSQWLLEAPQEAILSLLPVRIKTPSPAQIEESIPCALCKEATMASRLQHHNGQALCIPCFENSHALVH